MLLKRLLGFLWMACRSCRLKTVYLRRLYVFILLYYRKQKTLSKLNKKYVETHLHLSFFHTHTHEKVLKGSVSAIHDKRLKRELKECI